MKSKLLLAAVSTVSLMASMSASAHDEGWYLRGNAGYGVHTDMDALGGIVSDQHGNGLQSEGGIAASLGLGYDFGNNWRLELDGDSLWTDFGSISQIPSSFAKLRTNSLMLNALYDFDMSGNWEPYIGAGLGLIQGDASLAAHDFLNPSPTLARNPACPGPRTMFQGESCEISDKDSGFGWQLLAGLGYKLSDNLTWDTHYAYQNAPDFDLVGSRTNGITNAAVPINATLASTGSHSVLTGLRYRFGHNHAAKVVAPPPPPPPPLPPPPPPPPPPPTYTCSDGVTVVYDLATCPVIEQIRYIDCPDGSVVAEGSSCPIVQEYRPNLNVCGSSNVGIFNVNTSATPKQMSRLGTLPEFGDSHGLTPSQFYDKLNARYSASATDKAYLNYLFKSMGYANGWADAQPYMFSDDVLPVGTAGLLGLGEQHHFNYSVLPSNDRDRQAFRIQSANGQVVHFMKTCGNYFYGCE